MQAAKKAFRDWGRTPVKERANALRALAGRIDAHADELALMDAVDSGNAITGMRGDMTWTADSLRYDLASEEFTTDAEVEIVTGRYKARGGLLRGNVATNEWALESGVHGTISR